METLKTCPFCGGEAHLIGGQFVYVVRCEKCAATSLLFDTEDKAAKQKAIAAWNRRAKEGEA